MSTSVRTTSVPLLVSLLLAIPLALVIQRFADRGWVAAPLVGLVLLSLYALDRRSRAATFAAVAVAAAVVLAYGGALVSTSIANVSSPPQWDFRAFWVLARVADLGQDFYEPDHARLLAAAFQNTPDFLPELVFLYPPPSMFLFLPLGWFDIDTASLLWGVFHGLVLALDIWLLWRLFLRDVGLLGLLLTAAVVLLLRSTLQTVEYAQTNFLVLLFVLLLWQDRERPRAGIWLALGLLVKPIVAILGLFLVVRRRWSAVAVTLGTTLAFVGLSVVAFGVDTIRTYVLDNPAANAPDWAYTETINQSLLAVILRAEGGIAGAHPLTNPFFLLGAAVILGVTAFVSADREAVSDELALSLFIPTALLLYPSSSTHYAVALVVPILYLVSRRRTVPGGLLAVTVLAIVAYAFAGGLYSFVGVAVVWLALLALAIRSVVEARQLERKSRRGDFPAAELDRRRAAVLARY